MSLKSEQDCLAYAVFDLWMSRQLEKLVNQWIELAAPIDRDTWLDADGFGPEPLDARGARYETRN